MNSSPEKAGRFTPTLRWIGEAHRRLRIIDRRDVDPRRFAHQRDDRFALPWSPFLQSDGKRTGSWSLLGMTARGCVGKFFCMGDIDLGAAVAWKPSPFGLSAFVGVIRTMILDEVGYAAIVGLTGPLPDLLGRAGRLELRWRPPPVQ